MRGVFPTTVLPVRPKRWGSGHRRGWHRMGVMMFHGQRALGRYWIVSCTLPQPSIILP